MSQGFKNLLKINLFADDSFQPLLKKTQDYRKISQLSIDHFQSISKNYQSYEISITKSLKDYQQQSQELQLNIPQYYYEYIQLYHNIHSQQKSLSEKCANNFKELTSLCNNILSDYSNLILNFQTVIRSYKGHQQILVQLSKKYFRSLKTMLSSIQQYKSSFTDVKLIYNMQQKNKRYLTCQSNYKNLFEELQTIQEKVVQLNEQKSNIVTLYRDIQKEFKLTIKSIGVKQISLSKSFLFDFCNMQKIMITYLAQKKFTLEKIQLKSFLSSDTRAKEQQFFTKEIDIKQCQYCPSIIIYHKDFKQQYFPIVGKVLNNCLKDIQQKIQKRKFLNKKVMDFTNHYVKSYEKCYYLNLKDIFNNFQKIKKKIQQIFGKRLCSFLKSNNSIFEISIGINQKFLKRVPSKLKAIETCILEQTKMLDLFIKEFKTNIDNFLKKKQIKKIIDEKEEEFTQQEHSAADLIKFRSQFSQKAEYFQILINGFVQKFKKNQDAIKFQYNALVNDYSVTINQFYSLTCQYKELYFGQQDFAQNFKKFQADIDKTLEAETKFFQEINFGVLIKESSERIVFESQIYKVEEFKKIKKPMQIQIENNGLSAEGQNQQQKDKDKVGQRQKDKDKDKDSLNNNNNQQKQTKDNTNNEQTSSKMNQSLLLSSQNSDKKENKQKNKQFLLSKIVLLPDETFFNSYSCGMSDKIILTGRIYITNKRLCFHSKFNPKNVFFGDTFIQIPKKDIQKIQKRSNAIFFDNSLSVTTINGEVFLTSFFARNEAYETMCNALEINNDEVFFEPQQLKQPQNVSSEPQIVTQQDDLKPQQILPRQTSIQRALNVFNYKQLFRCQFSFAHLNALRFFRMFQDSFQFNYNRKTHKSFVWFFKGLMEHKDVQIAEWSPKISEFCNSGNIKQNAPEKFTRKMTCLVPVPPSGIPFMPKHCNSQENQTVYIISKDKIIIESIVQNSGVPYSDTFNIRMKKVIETSPSSSSDTISSQNQNQDGSTINSNQGAGMSCVMTVYFYVNFVTTTMMKNMIETRSFEQSKEVFVKYEKQVKKYFKHLQKLKNASNAQLSSKKSLKKGKNGQNLEKDLENADTEKNNQTRQGDDGQQEEGKLQRQMKEMQVRFQKGKMILLGSLVLNVLLILLLVS